MATGLDTRVLTNSSVVSQETASVSVVVPAVANEVDLSVALPAALLAAGYGTIPRAFSMYNTTVEPIVLYVGTGRQATGWVLPTLASTGFFALAGWPTTGMWARSGIGGGLGGNLNFLCVY